MDDANRLASQTVTNKTYSGLASVLPLVLGLLCSLFLAGPALAQSGGDYDVEWTVIGAAGDEFPSGGDYQIGFTMGQPSPPWIPSGGDYQSVNGYWSGGGFPPFIPILEASKWVTPDLEVAYHAEVTYTVEMTNTGPVGAASALLTDTLPTEVDFVRWVSQNGASYVPGPPEQITWNGPISAGNTATWSWVARHAVDYGGAVTNTAQFGCSDTGQTGSADAVFALDSTPPDPPRLVHPPDGTYTNTPAITLDWGASSSPDATGYWVDWNGVRMDVGNVTEYAPSALADGTYTWTVAAYDVFSNTSAYTDVWTFTIDTGAPAPPPLIVPLDGLLINDRTPVLTWGDSSSPDAAGYWLDFGGVVTDRGNTHQYTTGVLPDGVYTWTVATYDDVPNTGPFTDTWSFEVDATPPDPPSLISPPDGARMTNRNPSLTWSSSPSPDTTGYDLDFDGQILDCGDTTQYTIPLPLVDGVYTWTVAAYDVLSNTGAYTDVWSLEVDTTPPQTPTLLSPPNNTLTNHTTVEMVWQPSPDLDTAGYWLDWSGAPLDVGNTDHYTATALTDGTYTWTVAAYDDLGNTTGYTDVWSFTVDATPPAPPALLAPANGTVTSDTTPVLSWELSPSPDATGYLVDLQGNVTDVGDTTAYTPSALVDGVYTWTVGVYDLAANVAYTETWTIRVDTVAPQIIGTVPADEAEDVPAGQPLVIAFDEAIDPLSFACVVQPDPGGWAAAWSPDGAVVTLTHSAFVVETRYTATVASARDLAGNPMAGPYEWHFTTGSYMYYLPLIQRSYSSMPDLVVDIVETSSNTVTVVVTNRGNQTVTDDFWIDVYFNPRVRPPRINQPWRTIAAHGVTWGVALDLPPDVPLILTNDVADPFYFSQESSPPPLPVGQDVYAYVDSVNFATTYGAVLERDETNNTDGPVVSIAEADGDRLSREEVSKLKPEDTDDLPPRR